MNNFNIMDKNMKMSNHNIKRVINIINFNNININMNMNNTNKKKNINNY